MNSWTNKDIPSNLLNKTYVITGTSSGIGTVIAYELAKRGAKVIAGNRSIVKAQKAIADIQTASDDLRLLEYLPLDISSFNSVKEFAAKINKDSTISQIDGLILNAGIMALPERKESVDRFELQMATNVLGHHLLTAELMPKIQLASKSVVISTSSSASSTVRSKKVWDDLNALKKYDPWEVYGLSKIAAIQFRDSLLEIIKTAGLENKIHVHTTHPGLTATPLFDASKGVFASVFRAIRGSFMMDVEQGALSTLRAIVDETLPNGSFIGPGGLTGMTGNPKVIPVYNQKLALDPILRKKMWEFCNSSTGAQWILK